MVAMTSTASERLALLSSTAVLEKVLEKSNRGYESFDRIPHSHVEDRSVSLGATQAHPLTPRSLVSSQSRDSLSPHVVSEARRESPHASHQAEHMQQYRHNVTSDSFPGNSDYPPFPPLSHGQYTQAQTQASRNLHCNRTGQPLANLAPKPSSHTKLLVEQQHMAAQSLHSPYEGRSASSEERPSDGLGRPIPYYSPPLISVSEDCEEAAVQQNQAHSVPSYRPSYEALMRENYMMREQLHEKDNTILSLQQRLGQLESQINELRQLPTGKISHIPVDDMLRIMHEYGSEISNQTLPKRRDSIKKASIIRQFRRWNPEFFRWFIHVNGEWVPKLGREGELKRRAQNRLEIKRQASHKKASTVSSGSTMH